MGIITTFEDVYLHEYLFSTSCVVNSRELASMIGYEVICAAGEKWTFNMYKRKIKKVILFSEINYKT